MDSKWKAWQKYSKEKSSLETSHFSTDNIRGQIKLKIWQDTQSFQPIYLEQVKTIFFSDFLKHSEKAEKAIIQLREGCIKLS